MAAAAATQTDIRRLENRIKDLPTAEDVAAVAKELERLRGNLNKIGFALFAALLGVAVPLLVKALGG